MNSWHKLPFLRLIIPLITGIMLGIRGISYFPSLLGVIGLLLIVQYIFMRYNKQIFSYPHRWIPGLSINLFFLLLGWFWGYQHFLPHQQNYYGNYQKEKGKQQWIIKLNGPVSIREKSIRAKGEVLYLIDNVKYIKVCGEVILSFENSSEASALSLNDVILVKARMNEISGPSVPCSFDYASFTANKGILFQVFLKHNNWKLIKANTVTGLQLLAWRCQHKLVEIIREQSLGKDEQAVGCAMLLGYMDGFGQDLQGAYSRAGVTHILSVSGLHVGLVFVIFNRLLFFLNKNRFQKILKTILLIILTWSYALLTGLAPCVQRAAFMFSFLILAKSLKRKNNIINTLFASGFVLLLVNPANLFDYGFQLSYLALLGIVWLEPLVYPLLYIKYLWLDKIWKLTAVTLAAQLATGPLAVYHFHQFPTWFIPANLIVIPLSTIVMYLGICLLVTSHLPLFNELFTFCFGYSIKLMNILVGFTDKLPMNVIEALYPGIIFVILCYVIISLLSYWAESSMKIYLFLSLLSILFISILLSINNITERHKHELMFFSVNKQDWCVMRIKQKLSFYTDHNILIDSTLVKIKLKSYMQKNSINSIHWYPDTTFHTNYQNTSHLSKENLWINDKIYPDKYLDTRIQRIILGSSLPYKCREKWISWCKSHKVAYSDVKTGYSILSDK